MQRRQDSCSWVPSFSSNKRKTHAAGKAPGIAGFLFPDTIGFGVGLRRTCRAKAYLNQHWIPGSPRRPALVQSWAGLPARDSLKAGAGHPLIRGVQGLAAHGEVDRS